MLAVKDRVTISIDPEVLAMAKAEVESGREPDLSAAVESAIRAQDRARALREVVELAVKEHGPIGKEAEEWAVKELLRACRESSSSMQAR